MLLYKNIIKDDNPDLRKVSLPVELPLSEEDKNTLLSMYEYLVNGYDEAFVKKYKIRPGVGIAAPQIDVLKQMFAILAYDEKGEEHSYLVINPKITSTSEQLTYLKTGEGCLSVDKECKGYIHRAARLTAKCHLLDPYTYEVKETTLRLKGYIAVIFQHEYDHLYGKLFYDHINKENPFFVPYNSTPVVFKEVDDGE